MMWLCYELRCDVRVCRGRLFQSVSQGRTGVSSSVAMVDAENSRQVLSLITHPPIHHSNKKIITKRHCAWFTQFIFKLEGRQVVQSISHYIDDMRAQFNLGEPCIPRLVTYTRCAWKEMFQHFIFNTILEITVIHLATSNISLGKNGPPYLLSGTTVVLEHELAVEKVPMYQNLQFRTLSRDGWVFA